MKKCLLLMLLLFSIKVFGQDSYIVSTQSAEEKARVKDLTEEERFVRDNFDKINIADWHKGMRFMAVYKKDIIDMSLLRGENGGKLSDYYHHIIVVDSIVERTCAWDGKIKTYIVFKTDSDTFLEYEFPGKMEEMRNANFYGIKGIVSLDEVDTARKLLLGKTLYTKKNEGYYDTDKGLRVMIVKKMAPYRIEEIGVGNEDCGIKLIAKGNDGKKCCFVVQMHKNSNAVMIKGNGYFHDTFYLSNPRTKYKNIPLSIWNLIISGKVQRGMTKEQCRLSWGNPEKVNVTTGAFGTHEQWVYYGDSYLYFENGKLTAIQN